MEKDEVLIELKKINSNLEKLISLNLKNNNSTNNAEKIKNDVLEKINTTKLKIDSIKASVMRDKE